MTVARRIELAHEDKALESVETTVLNHNPVVILAKVQIKGQIFTGISSVNLDSPRAIEKQNPYEVAETSAVGRALGFAGYGLIESVASADEVVVAESERSEESALGTDTICPVCGSPAVEKQGVNKKGLPYHGIFCSTEDKSHTQWLQ